MSKDRETELFKLLVDKTKARSLQWEPGASEGEFVTSMAGKYTVKLHPYTYIDDRGEEQGPPSVEVTDDKGMITAVTENEPFGATSSDLRGFAELVRRTVYRIDEKIDDLLFQLKKLPGEPSKEPAGTEITDEDIPF